jgi:ATP:ADP antiporter, AAA family
MPDEHPGDEHGQRSAFERFLGIFAEVRGGEGINAVLMFLNIFLILAAYYILKTVREGLTIAGITLGSIEGDEAKTYLNAIMTVVLLGFIPAYGYLGTRMGRLKLIWTTMTFLVLCLVGFLAWGQATGVGTGIGITFFVWLGAFNYFLVAQFWSYANDIYTEEQGKRLFAVIAIGQSAGAVTGPFIAEQLSDYTFLLLGLAALLLIGSIVLYTLVNGREARSTDAAKRALAETPLSKEGGFELVFKTKYLFLIAMTMLVTNLVNTTGEYILSNAAKIYASEQVPAASVVTQAPGAPAQPGPAASSARPVDEKALTEPQKQMLKDKRSPVITRFYARFFFFVNLFGVLIQMFLVSRIFKYLGIRVALFVLPVIAFGGYAAIGVIGGLLVIRAVKTAENATDYSLQNTVKQALYLPTSREAKYKAKAVIDVFFVRFGDTGSALVVGIGLHALAFGVRQIAFVNVFLSAVWLLITVAIAREHRRLAHEADGKAGTRAAPTTA